MIKSFRDKDTERNWNREPSKRLSAELQRTTLRKLVALARIIHEGFYCNRRYAAATSLTAGGLAARSVNILFQVCLPSSRLRAPVSLGVSAVSSRTLVNNAG